MVVEPEFTVTHLGDNIFDLLGCKARELFNKSTMSYLQLLHPEYHQILETKKNSCSQSREPRKLEYHLYTKARTLKLVEDHFIGECDGVGRLVAINGYFREVGKSSVKLQLLNQLEAYRAAIDVNIISSITDSNRRIIYVNENFRKVSKYSDEEILGKTHDFLNSGYHPPSFIEDIWQTVSGGKMWQGEILVRAKDGSLNWADTVIIPTFDGRNEITSYLFLSVLINERKLAEEQKEKYVRVLEEIAHVVAHDLRGPVCTILGLANLIEKTDSMDRDFKPAKDHLVNAANKLDQITRDLSLRIYSADQEMRHVSLYCKARSSKRSNN
jgi:PAS domain S-box-containing protein